MNRALRDLLRASGGIIHHADALAVVPIHVLRQALRSRRLRRVLPLVYADADLALDSGAVAAAALRYTVGRAALSHTSALRVWRLPAPEREPLHLTVADTVRLRGSPAVRVHRRDGFEPGPPQVVMRGGYPVTRLETSIIEAWPLLDRDAQRAPTIRAVAERLTTPGRLAAALEEYPRLAGRRVLTGLLAKLAAGCRSELEIWGYDEVFRGIPGLRWQHPLKLQYGTVYLDVFDPGTRTNFELDGARYHLDRERDLRRDAALAVLGIRVVRFSHDRLVREPARVREEVSAILEATA